MICSNHQATLVFLSVVLEHRVPRYGHRIRIFLSCGAVLLTILSSLIGDLKHYFIIILFCYQAIADDSTIDLQAFPPLKQPQKGYSNKKRINHSYFETFY